MTIAEIIGKLSQEKRFGSRFPARIIFVDDLSTYSTLVSKLKSVCDVTINIAEFCKANDIAPQFDKLRDNISTYTDQHILLLSVGEYLRMCIKRELSSDRAQFRAFWEIMQPEASRIRYIMPVFCCRDLFDRVIGKVDERQEDFVWVADSDAGSKSYSISVYAPIFAGTINPDADNMKSWLEDWDIILSMGRPCTVITKQYRNIEDSYGTVGIKTIDSPYSYLLDVLYDADALKKEWQDETFWAELIPYAQKNAKFSSIVLRVLNINDFNFVSVAARWKTLSDLEKNLVWLWYRVYPTEEYYSYACKKADTAADIPARIRDEILLLSSRSDEWIKQRMLAIKAISFKSFDDSYFTQLDKLPLAEMKLQLLTYQTHEECAYAIKVISGLLRNGIEPDAVAELIKVAYPILATYLKDKSGLDEAVDNYLSWYRKNKLSNRFPGNYPQKLSFDKFDSRFKILYRLQGKDCFTLWIDGFGMEWLPIFLKELERLHIVPETKNIATAILPTETKYNHQWDENDPMSDKWGRLDSFSHKGMPDDKSYYSCIVYQLSVFADAAKKVDELLDEHEYVAITGDHGSSRLAALAFHDSSVVPIIPPQKATVCSFGRFCEFAEDTGPFIPLPGMETVMKDGRIVYAVMNDYQHFAVSGNAAGGNSDENDVIGEIHGGNTPEERLVPVVVVKRSQPLPPMTCKPQNKFITKKNGYVETNLSFNRPVSSLEVSIGGNPATCTANPDGTWHILVSSVPDEELQLSVVANGRLLSEKVVMKVKPQGISKNDDKMGL